jgi:hypothetical protein
MIAYPFANTGRAESPEDALSCALALQRIAFLMASTMKGEDVEEDGDEELLAHLSLYGWAWTRRASELLAGERAAATPSPAPPENVTNLMTALKKSLKRQRGKGA